MPELLTMLVACGPLLTGWPICPTDQPPAPGAHAMNTGQMLAVKNMVEALTSELPEAE